MAELENILGLQLNHERFVADMWLIAFVATLDAYAGASQKEQGKATKRYSRIESGRSQRYRQALEILTKRRQEAKDLFASCSKRDHLTERDTRFIRLIYWEELGNKIPWGELNPNKASRFLHSRGFVFRSTSPKGWYRDNQLVGRDFGEVLDWLEQTQPVNRLALI